jgi:hypothetical protein
MTALGERAARGLEVRAFDGPEALVTVAPAIDGLCDTTRIPLTGRPAWALAAVRSSGPAVRPWTVIASAGGELQGAAMLAQRTSCGAALLTTPRAGRRRRLNVSRADRSVPPERWPG